MTPSLRLLPFIAALLATPALAQQPPSPAPLIARYDAWRGGQAFQALATLHEAGAMRAAGLDGTVEIWGDRDGRAHQDQDLAGIKGVTIITPQAGWSTNLSGQVQALSPTELRQAKREATELLYGALHGAQGGIATLAPPETLDGQPVSPVRLTYPDGGHYDYLITAAGELLAIRAVVNGQTSLTRYSDWRTINGVKVPAVEATTGEQPTDASTVRYATIETGVPLKPALFIQPTAIKHVHFAKGADTSGWINFELFSGNRIYIPAEVNGHKTLVLLDSGAETSVLDRRFAAEAGLTPKGAGTVQGTGGASTAGLLTGVTIRIGNMSLDNINPAAIDLSGVEQQLGHPVPVILGAEIFYDSVIEIDFPGRRIAFHDPDTYHPPAGAVAEALSSANGIHTVPATVEGRPVLLDFDIGNGTPLLLNPNLWQAPGFMGDRKTSTSLAGGVGGLNETKIAVITSLRIGGAEFKNIPTTLMGNESAGARSGLSQGNVGLPILSRFRLITDFAHSRVLFARPVDAATGFAIDHSGLGLQPVKGGATVAYVVPGSPGDLAGLKAGDTITAIDNGPVQPDPSAPFAAWRYGNAGTVLHLHMARGDDKTLTLGAYY